MSPVKTTIWLRVALFLGAGLMLLAVAQGRINVDAVQQQADRLNGWGAFAVLTILPLLGFPVSVLHVAAGMRFGAVLGMALVALSILLQLLASYAIVRRWRHRFGDRFRGLRRRIPAGAHASIAVFAVLIPGAPYAAINYVLPLIGIRLRTMLLCCWPMHVLRSTVTVLLGDQAGELTPERLVVLATYALLLAGGSWWLYRRLRQRLEGPREAEGGRMQPA